MGQYENEKTFVVAWMTLFDNILYQKQVEALHVYHALDLADTGIFDDKEFHTITNISDLHDLAYDRDCIFSVIEVKPE